MERKETTTVVNIFDDRVRVYELPPEKAVVAAYEEVEEENYDYWSYPNPEDHPQFQEYELGFACGDWVAWKRSGGRLAS
ncbi:hypothetical protein [Desulforhabdus amnigena]|jgi:hypothetical protein|uniref:Uncharacterized protein n=1 Tax=Desulforhabdus amnigena TaxID=40218 RepID=A0A9W6FT04_9BACT|nr:hypothetical protein [Desulforhabdus amnigena]NLJ26453.1 hypothetical protein [Deltaproteobacteria bacterium]GLI34668.1 hypothetical protein DAMNIGENAA_21010 [Desulforhabdus amnigena]